MPTVRTLASVFPGADRLVPQKIYRPPADPDSDDTPLTNPVMFYVVGTKGCGIGCEDALNENFTNLLSSVDAIDCPSSITLWILVST